MELRPINLSEGSALHSQNLGLRGEATPWDHLAEAWRSSLWALCHPHWQPATTQKFRGLFNDIAGPVLLKMGYEQRDKVLDHLESVGDLVRLSGGYWLPAPSKVVDWGSGCRPQLVGGTPSWVLEQMHPRWGGEAGFRRTAEDLDLPTVSADEWCDRSQHGRSMRSLQDGAQTLSNQPARPFELTGQFELSNRALRDRTDAVVGTWMVVKDQATHGLHGVAERTPSGWVIRSAPVEIDPPAAALICQVSAGGYERWRVSQEPDGLHLHLYRKLPRWHRSALLSHALQPEVTGEGRRGFEYLVTPESLTWLEANVFRLLQMRKA